MPGFYSEGEYDIAGTIVGVVDERRIVDGKNVKRGDVLIALPSTGMHTNGYSLARAILLERFRLDQYMDTLGATLGETLLAVHRSYLKVVHPLLSTFRMHAMSHITGGGIEGNTMRVIPKGLRLNINWNAWERPAIFRIIQEAGSVPEEEMRKTFNLGVGLILIIPTSDADRVLAVLKRKRERPFVMGEVVRA
jgi:phosphoribosylformylglycinamidine cyclo-ligase